MVKLTTIDNPWNPFTHPDEWEAYDANVLGYHSYSWLVRATGLDLMDQTMTPQQREDAVEMAIDQFVHNDPLGIYIKLKDDDKFPLDSLKN